MSPHSSEKDTEQNMRNKPPAVEMVTYTRLNRIKHLATSKKRENQIPALFLLLEQKGKRKRKMLKTSSTLVPAASTITSNGTPANRTNRFEETS